jgi:hypothetical protein
MANESAQPTPAPDDPLEALSERVRAAQAAADRLVREATAAAEEAAAEAAASGPADAPGGEASPGGGAGGGEASPGGGPSGAGSSRRPPPRGYASADQQVRSAEVQALAALIELAQTLVPPELRRQLADLVRELLLLVRAVIDWYLERLELRRRADPQVEDIPIG